MVTIDPPDSTNFLSCGRVLSSETRPCCPAYSSATAPPPPPRPPPPPPPRPPRPPPAPRFAAPAVNTITSNLLRRSPASSVAGYTVCAGKSYCSKSHFVHPVVMLPPYES